MAKIFAARWPRLLTETAAAEYFSVSVTSLRKLDLQTIRIAHRPLYDRYDLDAWVARQIATAATDGVDRADDPPFELVRLSEDEDYDWRANQPGLRSNRGSDEREPPVGTERDVFSVALIAERWGIGTDAVYTLIRSGDLIHFKLGSKLIRVKREWIEKYEKDHPALPAARL